MTYSERFARAAGSLAVAVFLVCMGPVSRANDAPSVSGPLDMRPIPCDPKVLVAVPVAGSPDGNHVLLLQYLEEQYTQPQLYVANLATSELVQLTNSGPMEFMAAVFDPPHGATVTYVSIRKHGGKRDWETPVKRVRIDGTGCETVLTLAKGTTVHSLSWDPSGKTLAILQTLAYDKSGATTKISLWDGERLTDCYSIRETRETEAGEPQLDFLAWLSDHSLLLRGLVTTSPGNAAKMLGPKQHTAWMVADMRSTPPKISCVRTDDAPCYASAVSPDGHWLACSLLGATEVVSLVDGRMIELTSKEHLSLTSVVIVGAWLKESAGLRLLVGRPTGKQGPMFPAGPLTPEVRPYIMSNPWWSSPQP